jgi:hypothetical protein
MKGRDTVGRAVGAFFSGFYLIVLICISALTLRQGIPFWLIVVNIALWGILALGVILWIAEGVRIDLKEIWFYEGMINPSFFIDKILFQQDKKRVKVKL